jgi:hypothetical protein
LTIPSDLPVSASLPAGSVYRVFGKLAAAANGGTDAYWTYPELIVVAPVAPTVSYKIALDTPTPITVTAGQTVTLDFTYSAPAAVGGEFQLYETDSATIWGGVVSKSLPITQYPTLAVATDVKTSVTLTIPSDLPVSASLPAGSVYRVFGKLAAAANGGTDAYWTYPELIVVAPVVVTVPYKIALDTPAPITVTAGQTITLVYTYSAPASVGGEFQLYETDSTTIWGGAVSKSLPITQNPTLAAGSDVKKTLTLTIPADLPVSASLAVGTKYRVFGKLAAAANGGADVYWSYPELIVVANLGVKSFNANGVKVIYNAKSKNLVFFNIEDSAMVVYDSKGSKVVALENVGQNNSIDVSSFSPGLYILKSYNGSAYKFVVN